MAHKAAREIVTIARYCRPRRAVGAASNRLNGLSEFWGDAPIGIDHQHVIARGVTLRTLTLNTVAPPVGVGKDFALAARQRPPYCPYLRVENDDFVSPATEAVIRKQVVVAFWRSPRPTDALTLVVRLRQIRLQKLQTGQCARF